MDATHEITILKILEQPAGPEVARVETSLAGVLVQRFKRLRQRRNRDRRAGIVQHLAPDSYVGFEGITTVRGPCQIEGERNDRMIQCHGSASATVDYSIFGKVHHGGQGAGHLDADSPGPVRATRLPQ